MPLDICVCVCLCSIEGEGGKHCCIFYSGFTFFLDAVTTMVLKFLKKKENYFFYFCKYT